MSEPVPTSILAFVTHARHVPAVQRTRFAAGVRSLPGSRALVLETCHRVEVYTTSEDEATSAGVTRSLPQGGQALAGDAAVHHAIHVAVGLDSVVVGEDQILHQLRATVEAARGAGTLDPVPERLFAAALQAGRRARSWRHGPARSLADVAIASIEQATGPLRGREVLVVGAGRMGRLVVRAAAAAAATVAIANRSPGAAGALAAAVGARTESFDPDGGVGHFGGIVVALGGPWPVGTAAVEALARSTTVVVDLSVPQAVPFTLANALGTRLVTADALALADQETPASRGQVARLEALVDEAAAGFLDWLSRRGARAVAQALVGRADREREAELAALWRRLPDLDSHERDAIEGMARHLAGRLLRAPLERLGRDVDGRDERAIRDVFAL